MLIGNHAVGLMQEIDKTRVERGQTTTDAGATMRPGVRRCLPIASS